MDKVKRLRTGIIALMIILACCCVAVLSSCQKDTTGKNEGNQQQGNEEVNYFTEILDIPFLMRYTKEDGNWILTGNDENGEKIPDSSIDTIDREGLPFFNWAYIVFNFTEEFSGKKIKRIEFDVVAQEDCQLNIRVGGQSSSDPQVSKKISCEANSAQTVTYDIELTSECGQLYIVNEPSPGEEAAFESEGGYTVKWKISNIKVYLFE